MLRIVLILAAAINLWVFLVALNKIKRDHKFYDNVNLFLVYVFGIFVWGDALILSPFFIAASIILYIINNAYLTLGVFSAYHFLRQGFEVVYWFLQQFSMKQEFRPPDRFFKFLKTDELHIIYQLLNFYKTVIWLVVMIISFFYFFKSL
ncbi:hypothetical protein C4569_03685 [Candidatus Parcubacteria bacterium]|nr:MAG: hypothetical protein C4569_03685 [Candidatus Parcubacteria bacterium]